MNRPTRFASRYQGQTRQLVIRNPTTQTDIGCTMAEGLHVSMDMRRREVEEARRRMQMKYDKEAEEAAKKKKEREQKKREAWLTRQEAIVRPGHVLGTSEKNLLRDFMEHEDGDECQHDVKITEQKEIEQHYSALVQQRYERERETIQLQRTQELRKQVTPLRRGNVVSCGAVSGSELSNQEAVTEHVPVLATNTATSPNADNDVPYVQPNHREEMLAVRRRLQEQYDALLKQAAKAKEQETKDPAERCECSSSS